MKRDPREEASVRIERINTDDLRSGAKTTRDFVERSRTAQYLLRTLGVFGVSLIMSDGVLTPAQSVLGAIQGIEVVSPKISSATIIGTSCAIIVLLFMVQPLGTTKIASSFAPIVIIWLLFNLVFGIYVSRLKPHGVDARLTLIRILLYTMHLCSKPFRLILLVPILSGMEQRVGSPWEASF